MEAHGLGHFRFALNETTLIGGRKQPLRSVDNVRRMVEGGTRRFRSPAELLEALIGQSLDGLSADHLPRSARSSTASRSGSSATPGTASARRSTRRAAGWSRSTARWRRSPACSAISNMPHHPSCPKPLADMAARLSNRATALHHDGEQLQARARLLQDELMAKLSAQSNQLLYFLSMMTAVLLPMTIISGLFGMNVGGIPLAENPHGFWIVSIFAAAVAAAGALRAQADRRRRDVIRPLCGRLRASTRCRSPAPPRSARTPPPW